MLQYAFYMYWGEIERPQYSIACIQALHPFIINNLWIITSNMEKYLRQLPL